MKDTETKAKFIELRARGLSFSKISKEIDVSKPTLIEWSKQFAEEIANAKSDKLEALKEQYCLSVEAKVKLWGGIVNRIEEELAERDLSEVDTAKLVDMLIKAEQRLESAYVEPEFMTQAEIDREKEHDENMAALISSLQK